jgi:hypothetical protein
MAWRMARRFRESQRTADPRVKAIGGSKPSATQSARLDGLRRLADLRDLCGHPHDPEVRSARRERFVKRRAP